LNITNSLITIVVGIAIISTIIITSTMSQQNTFSIITVGPVWPTNQWSCTSDADFMVYGALRSLDNSTLAISISELGIQSLYLLNSQQMQTFALGSQADHFMNITRTGTVTGWITIQTTGANANCIPI